MERAHIVPWRDVKEHKAENMICLCANCHQRADVERWGEKTLKEYKDNPWIVRRYSKRGAPSNLSRVQLTINCEYEDFDSKKQRLLQFGVAKFLGIEPDQVIIAEIKRGSVKITLLLQEDVAGRLVEAVRENDRELREGLQPLRLVGGGKVTEISRKKAVWQRTSTGSSSLW